MKVCKTVQEVREIIKSAKAKGQSVGLVPTMGALHAGHASLIAASSAQNDLTVVSVFVNPTQFAPNEDLDKYPRTLAADIELAQANGAQVIFNPEPIELYPSTAPTWVETTGSVTEVLCGQSRPIHFRGVTTVVAKLFNIVQPNRAYFGQKDAQQVQVIKKMVKDLMFDLEIVVMPIIREADGLAKSSRNTYLSSVERHAALVLSRGLELARSAHANGQKDATALVNIVEQYIAAEPLAKVDYVNIYALPELTECAQPMVGSNLLAVAVYFGKTRLIDNIILED